MVLISTGPLLLHVTSTISVWVKNSISDIWRSVDVPSFSSVIPSPSSGSQSSCPEHVSSSHKDHSTFNLFQEHDQNYDHAQSASLCIVARDAKGKFSTLLTAPTRTAVCWCQQSSKHPPPQRWVWHLRLLHDMQAQHFIRHGDFSWSANASHFQAHYIESVVKFQDCSTTRVLGQKGNLWKRNKKIEKRPAFEMLCHQEISNSVCRVNKWLKNEVDSVAVPAMEGIVETYPTFFRGNTSKRAAWRVFPQLVLKDECPGLLSERLQIPSHNLERTAGTSDDK